jgi:hypothetical protein
MRLKSSFESGLRVTFRRAELLTLASLITVFLVFYSSAEAAPNERVADAANCYDDLTGAQVTCEIIADGNREAGHQLPAILPGSDSGTWPPPGYVLITYPTFGVTDEGATCRQLVTTAVPAARATLEREMTDWYLMEVALLAEVDRPQGDCPPSTEPPIDALEAREAIVALLTQRLPRAQLHIAPGFGLAGMTAYLETGRDLSLPADPIPVALSTGTVDAVFSGGASYLVDWGDGTVTGPHAVIGDPWPDGTVTHTYIDKGSYEVQVVDRWSVTFTVDGLPPQTVQLDLDSPPLVFDVRERTAIRTARDRQP